MKESKLAFEELARLVVVGLAFVAGIVLGAILGGWKVAILAAFLYGFAGLCLGCVIAPRAVFRSRIYSRHAEYYRTGIKSNVFLTIILMPLWCTIGTWGLVWLSGRLDFAQSHSIAWLTPAVVASVFTPFAIARLLWARNWWLRQYDQ